MTQRPPESLARPDFASIPRYAARVEARIDLSDNTNAWGTPPAAMAALREAAANGVSGYPSGYGESLKDTVAQIVGVTSECVVTGNGSDDLLDCAIRAFASPGETVAHPDPTFVMVSVFARINNIVPVPVPLTADYEMDADAMLATNARIIYLCSPNNPTATLTSETALRKVIARAPGLVILDEAYAEFSGERGLLDEAPSLGRVLVCRTLSKAYGLAGLRAGYGTASPRIVETMERSRGPFKLNALAERAAVTAMTADRAWVQEHVREAVRNRERLAEALGSLGYRPLPSRTNFLLVPTPRAFEIAEVLRLRGIAIRPFRDLPSVGTAFRITAAPWPVLEQVLEALREFAACA